MKKLILTAMLILAFCSVVFAQNDKAFPVNRLRLKHLDTPSSNPPDGYDDIYITTGGSVLVLHPDGSTSGFGGVSAGRNLFYATDNEIAVVSSPAFDGLYIGESTNKISVQAIGSLDAMPALRFVNTEYTGDSYDAALRFARYEGKQINFIDEDTSTNRLKLDSPASGQLRLRDGDNNPALSGVIKSVSGVLTGGATASDLGLTSYSYFSPDKPPASPSALNQEFNNTFDITDQFTVIGDGVGVSRTFSTAPGTLTYVAPSTSVNTFRSIVEALPSGDFTVVAKVIIAGAGTSLDYQSEGLIFSDTSNGSSGNQFTVAFGHNTNIVAVSDLYTNWGSYTSTLTTLNGSVNSGTDRTNTIGYLKCTRSGTTYKVSYSISGYPKTWKESTIAPGFTPTYVGLFLNSPSGGSEAPLVVHIDWLRYWNSASVDPGGLIQMLAQ